MRVLLGLAALLSTTAVSAQVYVHGYTTKSGTYVAPHYRSAPDNNSYNNWSAAGNVNPYTGRVGTIDPYGASRSSGYGSTLGNSYGSTTYRSHSSGYGNSGSNSSGYSSYGSNSYSYSTQSDDSDSDPE
jgi:hypothetical protein